MKVNPSQLPAEHEDPTILSSCGVSRVIFVKSSSMYFVSSAPLSFGLNGGRILLSWMAYQSTGSNHACSLISSMSFSDPPSLLSGSFSKSLYQLSKPSYFQQV
jgi:hypothetical protein